MLVYQSVKKANRKSHLNNSMLCDRKASLRSSEIEEPVCLYNPAKKKNRSPESRCEVRTTKPEPPVARSQARIQIHDLPGRIQDGKDN